MKASEAELVASERALTQASSSVELEAECGLPAAAERPHYEYLTEHEEHYDCSGCESGCDGSSDDDGSRDHGSEGDGGDSDGGTDGKRAPINFNSVTYIRKDTRRRQRCNAEYIEWLASRLARLQLLPLKQLLGFYRKPDPGGVFGLPPRDAPLWCDVLPPAPQLPAKEQVLTPCQRDDLLCEAKHVVALMKETRRLDEDARILAAKAPYSLQYVAAALALLCGWFAKGNGTPNLTVAASKLRAPDAPALHTKATARIKAWMERLKQLDAALKAEWQTHYRIRMAQDEAEALEVLRRGIGPRTVIPATGSSVCGEGLFRQLLRTAVQSERLGSLVREPCSYPVCSGVCEGARKRPTNMAMRYVCMCGSREADAASQSSAEHISDAANIARAFSDVRVSVS